MKIKCNRYGCNEYFNPKNGGTPAIIRDGKEVFPALCPKHWDEFLIELYRVKNVK